MLLLIKIVVVVVVNFVKKKVNQNNVFYFYLPFQSKTVSMQYPGWGYAVIAMLICLSVLFIPIFALLRYFGILKYKKPTPKSGGGDVVAPGSVTPSMSRVPLPPMEEPLAGTREDED